MLSSEGRIATDRAERYLEQLNGHLGHMHRLRGGHGGHTLPKDENVVMEAGPDALTVRVSAEDPAELERLKSAIAARIGTIGRRDELTVEWRDQ